MKTKTHPQYFDTTVITCSCGNSFTTGSTLESIQVEVCSNCHPFFTGKQKFVDTARRVEKFQDRSKKADAAKAAHVGSKKAKRATKGATKQSAKAALKDALKS